MAVLVDALRRRATRAWIKHAFVDPNNPADMDNPTIRVAVNATDVELDTTSQSAIVAAMPGTFKTPTNVNEKQMMIAIVAMARAGLIDLLE